MLIKRLDAEQSVGLEAISDALCLQREPTTGPGSASDASVIVIGGGPSGIRVAQEVSRRGIPVILFNAERWQPYNRVKLTSLLAGDVQIGQVYQSPCFLTGDKVKLYSSHSIIDIDRQNKTVTGQFGRIWPYSKLVFCTGSRPYVPLIPGKNLPGVYTFRNFDDVEKLIARSFRSRHAVVIGGGLLGLEAARGMAVRGVEITIVEHERHLMARQLDHGAGRLLAREIEAMGIAVRTGCGVRAIGGHSAVESVMFTNGESLVCDSVILCTGIRSNIELARDVGLAYGRGIKVDACMRTSDPDIYAVGECAEFQGHIYGLVGPGLEQAAIAAANIAGEKASYAGSVPATKLKVVGIDVFSLGDVEQLEQRTDVETIIYEPPGSSSYRLLVLKHGRLVGAIAVGAYPEINRVQQAVKERRRIWPWQLCRFKSTGRIWAEQTLRSVIDWPGAATVCNFTGVTRGQIGDAIALGCTSLQDVKRDTGASSVCGSCRPLIEQLLSGEPVKHEPVAWFRPILFFSMLTLLAALATIFLPAWPYTKTVQQNIKVDQVWRDGSWKQVSGFTLLGLSVAAALLSLRKRIRWLNFGGFNHWRLVHIGVGGITLAVLFIHTGFRLGHNLNFWLMLTFLSLALMGAIAGGVTAIEHRLLNGPLWSSDVQPRRVPVWLHIIAFWPLPLLLLFHILSVYYY